MISFQNFSFRYEESKDFTKLNAFLVEAVHIPYKSLEHNLILKMCKKCTECLWCQFFTDDNT